MQELALVFEAWQMLMTTMALCHWGYEYYSNKPMIGWFYHQLLSLNN